MAGAPSVPANFFAPQPGRSHRRLGWAAVACLVTGLPAG